jgi:signal transduction histidine kinase
MVSSYLQLLENRYADELDQDATEFIGFAVDGADRMESMIDSLLEYSRVTSEERPQEPTDADAVLEGVLEDLQLRVEETDATVTADDLPTVSADPDQLAQVFQNLLENALRHSGDEPPRVHVGAEQADDGWRFSVRDEGIGIPPDQQERIFQLFEQGHAPDQGEGAVGMGLALCERIVEHHGGDIWVESEPGEGTAFHFTLPATAAAEN